MRLCLDLNSDLIWAIEDFLIINHLTESDLVLNYYEYKIRTQDVNFTDWICKEKRDILIYLEDSDIKYHELSGCAGIPEAGDLISVKIWFYRSGTQNMTNDRIQSIESRVKCYQRSQKLNDIL